MGPSSASDQRDNLTSEESYEKGMALFRAGKYDEAFPLLKRACPVFGLRKNKHPDGQTAVAWMYENGCGTEANDGFAQNHYGIAAQNGDPDGINGMVRLTAKVERSSVKKCQEALEYARQSNSPELKALIPVIGQKLADAQRRAVAQELNELNVEQLFTECAVAEDTPEDRRKGSFDADKLAKNKRNILYLLGQLPCVHQEAGEVPLDGVFLRDYLGRVWTNDGKNVIHLLNLGISAGCVKYYKDGEKDLVRMGSDVGPALSPKDPKFDQWFQIYDTMDQANSAYKEKNYPEALRFYLSAAELGDGRAQYLCGSMYEDGEGTAADMSKALEWYLKAAGQGDSCSLYKCGCFYESGTGTTADKEKALTYFEKAAALGNRSAENKCEKYKLLPDAEQGSADAQYKLAKLYAHDTKEKEAARMWLQKAADQGHKEACVECGMVYGLGINVSASKEAAAKYFQLAAQAGDSLSKRVVALMVKKSLFKKQIADFEQVLDGLIDNYSNLDTKEKFLLIEYYEFFPKQAKNKFNSAQAKSLRNIARSL